MALVITAASADTRSPKTDISRSIDIFTSVFKELQTNYVDSIDAEKSINTAIAAMLNDIDPYTEYYPASEQEDLAMMTSGEYGGIGAVITEIPGRGVFISEPYEGTPSQKAGLKAGDLIVAIDADTVLTWHNSQVSNRLKGEAGTPLTITVKRPTTARLDIEVRPCAQQDTAPLGALLRHGGRQHRLYLPHAVYRQIGGRRAQCTA